MSENDHTLLVRIDERVRAIHADLIRGETVIADHAKRIGRLERWRTYILGGLTMLGLVIGWLVV